MSSNVLVFNQLPLNSYILSIWEKATFTPICQAKPLNCIIFTPMNTLNNNRSKTQQNKHDNCQKRAHLQLSLYRFWCFVFLFPCAHSSVNTVCNSDNSSVPYCSLEIFKRSLFQIKNLKRKENRQCCSVRSHSRKHRHMLICSDSRNSWTGSHGAKPSAEH